MPVATAWCARPPHEKGRHRSPEGLATHYASNSSRREVRIRQRYEWLDALKLERGCEECGYRKDPRAIDFDHIRPELKTADVSRLIRYASWEDVLAEIGKCQILCSNCHRIKTHTPPE